MEEGKKYIFERKLVLVLEPIFNMSISKFRFSELSEDHFSSLINLIEKDFNVDKWNQINFTPCTESEQQKIKHIQDHLINYQLNLMNEATIWARAIYPLLLLAESGNIQAWAEVPLKARFPQFELEGTVDGVLGKCVAGKIKTPYLVVVEAKRGLEAKDPQFQLYGEMLAAAWLNWQQSDKTTTEQEIFGCYTISDSWTFLHGVVKDFEAELPTMTVENSREYIQRIEAVIIFQILKFMINNRN